MSKIINVPCIQRSENTFQVWNKPHISPVRFLSITEPTYGWGNKGKIQRVAQDHWVSGRMVKRNLEDLSPSPLLWPRHFPGHSTVRRTSERIILLYLAIKLRHPREENLLPWKAMVGCSLLMHCCCSVSGYSGAFCDAERWKVRRKRLANDREMPFNLDTTMIGGLLQI